MDWGLTDESLRIAKWRCRVKFGIPADLVDDYLHSAIVDYLVQGEHSRMDDEFSVPNWISRVAYYKYMDEKNRLSTRKTTAMPETYDAPVNHSDDWQGSEAPCQVRHVLSVASESQADTLNLVARCGQVGAAASLGVSRQAVNFRLKTFLKQLGGRNG